MTEAIFSFGTLRTAAVQEALFGHRVAGEADALPGYSVGTLVVTDPEVIRLSGSDRHPALREDPAPDAIVQGSILTVTEDELAAADRYERAAFHRIPVVLASGRSAWAYVPKS